MALHVIENNLKTIFDDIYVKSIRIIDKRNNKNICLCHSNNSTKNNFLIPFCYEEFCTYFNGLDSCYQQINDWKIGNIQLLEELNFSFLYICKPKSLSMTTNRQFLTNGRNRYSIKFNSTKPINQTLPKFAIASYVSIFIGYFINVSNLMQCTKIYATLKKLSWNQRGKKWGLQNDPIRHCFHRCTLHRYS